jgi:hypothetical protein
MFHPICHYFGGSRDRTMAVLIMDAARYGPFCRMQKSRHSGSGPLARPETGKARETLPAGCPPGCSPGCPPGCPQCEERPGNRPYFRVNFFYGEDFKAYSGCSSRVGGFPDYGS